MVGVPDRHLPKITPELLPELLNEQSRCSRLATEIGHDEARAAVLVKPGGTAIEKFHRPGRSNAFGAFFVLDTGFEK